ncbi:MAG: hypothetical protein IIC61_12555, partial [Proteobacteria bacterium]|nr:hypothetical protein [Pseudomonadota bacterium]
MNIGLPQDFRRYLSLRGASVTREEVASHQPLTLRALGIGNSVTVSVPGGSDDAGGASNAALDLGLLGASFSGTFTSRRLVSGLNTIFL